MRIDLIFVFLFEAKAMLIDYLAVRYIRKVTAFRQKLKRSVVPFHLARVRASLRSIEFTAYTLCGSFNGLRTFCHLFYATIGQTLPDGDFYSALITCFFCPKYVKLMLVCQYYCQYSMLHRVKTATRYGNPALLPVSQTNADQVDADVSLGLTAF